MARFNEMFVSLMCDVSGILLTALVVAVSFVGVPLLFSLIFFLLRRSGNSLTLKIMRVVKWLVLAPAWIVVNISLIYAISGDKKLAMFCGIAMLVVYIIGCIGNWSWMRDQKNAEMFCVLMGQPFRAWWQYVAMILRRGG